jgi:adhesin/invasin
MTAIIKACALAIFAGAMANAATPIATTLTVNATGSITSLTVSGTATLTNFGSGTFSSTVSIGANITGDYTITLSGGTITGVITLPASVLTNGGGTGSATVTGGTGGYVGATGSFPALIGTGSLSLTSGSVTLTFSGAGSIAIGGAPNPVPTITAVQDAGSYTANIAEGSIFVVKGTNLSASGYVAFGFPLPSTCTAALCSGATSGQITFTPVAGGSATQAYLVYLYNQSGVNQLAAILPSGTATGNYNVTVTNNTGAVSAAFPVTVVQRKVGLITQDGSGSGLAVVQNYISATELDVDRFTVGSVSGVTISPARPGQTLIAWATGMGPVTGGDNTASPGFDFTKNGVTVQMIVGGMAIAPLYAGRAPGLAGADQINFVLPSNVPTGCTVSFQVSVNGVLSNPTFIAIAPDQTSSACVLPGFTASQLQSFDNGGTVTTGGFVVTQFSTTQTIPGTGPTNAKIDAANGAFATYTGFQIASFQNFLSPSNSCQAYTIGGASQSLIVGGTDLDAGAVTLTGPSGSGITNLALQETSNAYSVSIATELSGVVIPGQQSNVTVIPGTYTLKGAGGKDVGAFNASMTLGAPLTITGGLPTTVTRASGLTLNWTGGNSTDLVLIVGGSGPNSGATQFVCTTTAGKGTFTVPASILNQLPASSAAATTAGTATSFLSVESTTNPTASNGLFSAPLTAGGSIGNATFLGLVGTASSPTYQ